MSALVRSRWRFEQIRGGGTRNENSRPPQLNRLGSVDACNLKALLQAPTREERKSKVGKFCGVGNSLRTTYFQRRWEGAVTESEFARYGGCAGPAKGRAMPRMLRPALLPGAPGGIRVSSLQILLLLAGYRTMWSHESPPTISVRDRLSSEATRRKYLIPGFDRVLRGEVKNSVSVVNSYPLARQLASNGYR